MRAAVLDEFKAPLSLREVSLPSLGPEDVLIEVDACGVCHSDLHVARGDWASFEKITKRPVILGHEIAGRVVETGAAVQSLKPGDRVGVPWLYWSCGECEPCRGGHENLCTRQKITGVTVDGGYAEFMKAPATHAIKIPDALSPVEAAPLFCAGVTVYRALKQANVLSGQRVGIFGVGGLGHLAVQVGRRFGADVIAIDLADEKLALARSLGAAATFLASGDLPRQLRGLGGLHVALVTSAAKAAYDTALACLRPAGILLIVGLPPQEIGLPPMLMAAGEIRVQASAVGTRQDLIDVLELAAHQKIRPHVAVHPLGRANEVLEDLHHGRITGRAVLTPR